MASCMPHPCRPRNPVRRPGLADPGLEDGSVHELSIVEALLEQVGCVQEAHGGRVSTVTVRVGKWRQVVPEVFRFHYDVLTREGRLSGSRLELIEVDTTALCTSCGALFTVEDSFVVCPVCSALGATLMTGDELDLVSIELED
jgi:hydrogenase nickel incorporation protein HypA/HybF